MKCIILAGVPRSGKSILANMLGSSPSFSRLPIDPLITTFEEILPSYGISVNDYGNTCKKFHPFLVNLVGQFEYEFMNVVVDGYYILPKWFAKKPNYKVVFMGYPSINPKVKFDEIRLFENNYSWTKDMSDDQVMGLVKIFILQSKEQRSQCKKLGIKFVDMSFNFGPNIEKLYVSLRKFI